MAYELVDRQELFKGRIIKLTVDKVRFLSGADVNLEVLHHPGGAAVVALTNQDQVALVKQYRHPMGEYLLELPAGKLEPGDNPVQAARRELAEEAGLQAENWQLLSQAYPAPGYCSERLYIYLATELTEIERQPDEDEEIDVIYVSFKEACEMAMRGEICDAKTIIGLLMAERLRQKA